MFHWVVVSFKRKIIFMLFSFTLFITVIAVSKFYAEEKVDLYNILANQVSQMAHQLSLSIQEDVFYNNYLDIYDNVMAIYNFNHLSTDNSSLFKILNIAVLAPDNKIIAHSNPKKYPIATIFPESVVKKILEKANITSFNLDNEDQIKIHFTSAIYREKEIIGYLHIEVAPAFLDSNLNKLLANILIPVFIFIAGFVVFSFFFAQWIDRPLLEILKQLDQIGTNNIQFPLSLKREDEFKTLAQAIVKADERIVSQNTELLAIQKDLEQRVEQRTIELTVQTEELTKTLSDLKAYQKQLVESEKMASLGSLVSGVAHEINTPLGVSITGITHIETENTAILNLINDESLTRSKLLKYLNMVTTMTSSMHLSLLSAAKLVTSFKQIATDQYNEDKRTFNLKAYSEQVIFSLHSKLRNLPITIENNIDDELEINSYAGIFSQIFTNFIMNSLVHAFNENTKNGLITIKSWQKENNLYLSYEDNGKGIEEQYLNRIFEPFFTTKMGKGGSGLGLSIIYNLVNHRLKGTINCRNKTQGIIITIVIPTSELL